MVTDEHTLRYDIEVYEYQTGSEVEEIMGSQYNKEWKRVSYLVK
jgi:hypothetical protein